MADTVQNAFDQILVELAHMREKLTHSTNTFQRDKKYSLVISLRHLDRFEYEMKHAKIEWEQHLAHVHQMLEPPVIDVSSSNTYIPTIFEAILHYSGMTPITTDRIHDYILMNVHDIFHDWEFQPDYPTWLSNMHDDLDKLESSGYIVFDKQSSQWSITEAGHAFYEKLPKR